MTDEPIANPAALESWADVRACNFPHAKSLQPEKTEVSAEEIKRLIMDAHEQRITSVGGNDIDFRPLSADAEEKLQGLGFGVERVSRTAWRIHWSVK